MIDNDLFNAIFKRKSIRKYTMQPLDGHKLNQIKDYADKIKPLDQNIRYEISYLVAREVKSLFPIKAPHYMCIFSEKKDNYLMNVGYLLQQMDLYLSANHLGSCWLGMGKLTKDIPSIKNGMEFVIMLAFGEAEEHVHRNNISEFNRKSLSDISTLTGYESLLEAVRLAPSATNSQAWFFSGSPSEIIVSRQKLNFLKAALYEKINQIDIGIALYHLVLALEKEGKKASFDFNPVAVPDAYEFMVKVIVKHDET